MNSQANIQPHDMITSCYERAKTINQGFFSKTLVRNDTLYPHWIKDTNCFWYERATKLNGCSDTKIGKEYRLVDAETGSNQIAFNHEILATALAETTGKIVDKDDLPITHITFTLSPSFKVSFKAFKNYWLFDGTNKCCQELLDVKETKITEALSPDGRLLAFTRNYNLWVRDLHSGEERALTSDGEEHYAYGGSAGDAGVIRSPEVPALWSPDSTKLLTIQRDRRLVKTLPIVDHVPQDDSIRPTLRHAKVAYPGDERVETYEVLAIDISSGKACRAKHRPVLSNRNNYCGFFGKVIWWAKDSRHAYFIDPERGEQLFQFVKFDSRTGVTKVLFEETSNTQINYAGGTLEDPLARLLPNTNELVWWSERSGWGHLYLYDLNTGELKQTITSGDWRVRNVLLVDEQRREIFIQTSGRVSGRDPYYRDICRVHIDTGEISTLYSCDQEMIVHHPRSTPIRVEQWAGRANALTGGVAPSGDYIVTTRSRVDEGSTSLLIDREGNEILELESTDLSSLPSDWEWPEPVQVLAADGMTALYGTVFRPPGFSPDQSYPVINFIASGPWLSVVPKASFHSARVYSDRHYFHASVLAALGFVVVILDSRGTDLRSKAFQDESYGWVPSAANTDDHACAIKQLAERYPYMDINRVGIFCQAYRSGLQNFLERQDLYKVCVQMSLLDDRFCASYGEKYEGVEGPSEDKHYPEQLVDKLEGKLLLMNSMSSTLAGCYPVAGTFRVIDALQKANKDFDLLIVPHGGHLCDDYMFRRAFDYLVKHLLEIEPPKEFMFGKVIIA